MENLTGGTPPVRYLPCVVPCKLYFAVLLQTADRVIGQGQTDAGGSFGAMLLREDAGGYVLVGVAAFAAAVVLTVVCMRLHEREKQKQKHEEDAT